MTALFRLTVVAFVVLVVLAAYDLPASVPVRFDEAGQVVLSRPRGFVVAGMAFVGLMLTVLTEAMLRHLPRRGSDRLGLPFREHWVIPANRARFERMLATDVAFFGACSMLLLCVLVVGAARAVGTGTTGLGNVGVVAVLGYAMATLTWVTWMFTTRYRPRRS